MFKPDERICTYACLRNIGVRFIYVTDYQQCAQRYFVVKKNWWRKSLLSETANKYQTNPTLVGRDVAEEEDREV